MVEAVDRRPPEGFRLTPEHRQILSMSRDPVTVVDLASDIALPVGVVHVLLGDLTGHGMLKIHPARGGPATDARLLRDIRHELEAL